jgi:hypothetical protein
VFAGGWTAEAARQVCGPDSLPPLLQLARKSLVATATAPQGAWGEARYRLLETVREYAGQKLRRRGEAEELRDRHLDYYLALAESERKDIGGRDFQAWLRRVAPEYDNLRAALDWAGTRDDRGETELRLAAALGHYWHFANHIGEGLGRLDTALERGGNAPAYARARALVSKAGLHLSQGTMASAISLAEAGLALFRQADDPLGLAWCLEFLANNRTDARAGVCAEEALPLFRALGAPDGEARALRGLGMGAYRAGDHASAAQRLEQDLAIAQEVGDGWEISECLNRLYDVDTERALELCAQELARQRAGGDAVGLAWILTLYGGLLLCQGEYERARPLLEEGVQGERRAGAVAYTSRNYFSALGRLGFTELALGHTDQGVARLEESRKLTRDVGLTLTSYIVQFLIDTARIAQGDTVVAASDARECLRRFHAHGWLPGVVCAFLLAADVARRREGLWRASRLLGMAEATDREVDPATWRWESFAPWPWHREAQRAVVAPIVVAARAELGDAEFEAVRSSGQHMTLEQAVAYALQEGEADEPPLR